MSELTEPLAEALANSWLGDQLDCAEVVEILAPTLRRMIAEAEQRGAERT